MWFGLVWTFDFLVDVIDFRGFLKISVMKSVGKQIEIIKKQYTVEPLLSGHPRGMARWPLNRGGRLIEVCQI